MRPSQTIFDYAKLRGAIREHFGTEGAFAKAIDRSPNYISKVFQGKSNFSAIDVVKAAEALQISTDDIGKYFFEKR
jgi:transcriptional regulator with XRE-family HTH domain